MWDVLVAQWEEAYSHLKLYVQTAGLARACRGIMKPQMGMGLGAG